MDDVFVMLVLGACSLVAATLAAWTLAWSPQPRADAGTIADDPDSF